MIGPVANSVCIVAGSILGALCGPVLSQEFRKKIMNVFSCITLGIGVTMLSKGDSLPPVVLSLLLGTALGELTRFESLVMKGAFKAGLFKRSGKAKGGKSETLSETVFRDQFAVATVLFCVSGLGIIGSMREGLTGECSLLLIKGVLDLFTAMLISASIGSVVGVLAVPQCGIQLAVRGHDAHAVHHADHVRGFLRVRRHHHARRGAAPDGVGAGPHPQHAARPVLRHAAVRIVETDHVDGGSRRRTALRKRGGVRTVCFPRPSSFFPRRP